MCQGPELGLSTSRPHTLLDQDCQDAFVCAPQEDVPELGSLALSRYAGPHVLLGCGWFVPHPLWWAPLPPTTLPARGQPGHFFPVKGSSLVRTWCV